MADNYVRRGRVSVHTFGPGSLESCEVRVWKRRHLIKARLTGQFKVYCAFGHEHTQSVDESTAAQTDTKPDADGWDIVSTYNGNHDAASNVANTLLDYALYGWNCPNDTDDDERQLS